MLMTSVSGHLTATKFTDEYERDWSHPPPDALFDAPVLVKVEEVRDHPRCGQFARIVKCKSQDKKPISDNISNNARGSRALFIWTDCDREGEHIGGEVRSEALKGNPNLEVRRAKFSNIERA